MECLDHQEYVKRRMSALGLDTPTSLFGSWDQMLARATQIAAVTSVNPAMTVSAALNAGTMSALGVIGAGTAVYYLSAYITTLFLASAEGAHCRNTNSLNSHMIISFMYKNGIYDTENVEAELMRSPQLLVG